MWLFSRKCVSFFSSPNLKKKIFQKAILSLKFKFPTNNGKVLLARNLNFKLRIVFWNIFFLRFGDLKYIFEKKATFIALQLQGTTRKLPVMNEYIMDVLSTYWICERNYHWNSFYSDIFQHSKVQTHTYSNSLDY